MSSLRRRPLLLALVIAACFGLVIALGSGLLSGGPQATNPIPPTIDSIDRGRDLFAQSCAQCHGVDARGGGPLSNTTQVPPPALTGPSSHLTVHSDADLFQFISDGLPGGMPAWVGKLKDDQIWDVINFLRSIQAGG
jgi:mono/diheme cytochrome c family protein